MYQRIFMLNSRFSSRRCRHTAAILRFCCRLMLIFLTHLFFISTASSQGLPFIRNFSPDEYNSHPQNWNIAQGKDGVMYFANGKGVLVYDGEYWQLVKVPNRGHVRSLAVDEQGTVYIGANGDLGVLTAGTNGQLTFTSWLDKIPPEHRTFDRIWTTLVTPQGTFFQAYDRIFRWKDGQIRVWKFDTRLHRIFLVNNTIYAIQIGKGLMQFSGENFELVAGGKAVGEFLIYAMLPLSGDHILIGTRDSGLYTYDGHTITPFFTNNFIREYGLYKAVYLPDSTIAVATSLPGGVGIMSQKGELLRVIDEKTGLLSNNVSAAFIDRQGALWTGAHEGISRIELNSPFSVYDERTGLGKDVKVVIRHQDTLFAGTGAGLYRLAEDQRFEFIPEIPYNCWAMRSFGNKLLIATSYGIFEYNEGKAYLISYHDTYPTSIIQSNYDTSSIFIAIDIGLIQLKWSDRQWTKPGQITSITGAVRDVIETAQGEFWLKTRENGIFQIILPVLERRQLDFSQPVIKHFGPEEGVPPGENEIFYISNEMIVRSEDEHAFRYDESQQQFVPDLSFAKRFGVTNGIVLPKYINNIGEKIWLDIIDPQLHTTAIALATLQNDGMYEVVQYPVNQLISKFKDPYRTQTFYPEQEVVWFGGINGLARYQLPKTTRETVNFSALIRRVITNSDSIVFAGAPSGVSSVTLPHRHNALRFEYTAPFYDNEVSNLYQTKLEGFDTDWSAWTTETRKDYTNLWESNYTFLVRAKNGYGDVSEVAAFPFKITPPWYRTYTAIAGYFFLLVVLVAGIVRWRSHKLRMEKRQLEEVVAERTEEVRQQAGKLKELDILKSRFFANISHEFRTPLTLILSPLEKKVSDKNGEIRPEEYQMMHRNAQRLLRLINQLLDLSKIEAGKMQLEPKRGDIIRFLKGIIYSFTSLAEARQITFHTAIPDFEIETYFDPDKLEKITYNLLSNAFKFTPNQGEVNVKISFDEGDGADHTAMLKMIITDTGKGIPMAFIHRIFDRFYQADSSHTREQEGTGIGLALTRELVELHNGQITVDSKEGQGTTFMVTFPLQEFTNKGRVDEQGLHEPALSENVAFEKNSTTDNPEDGFTTQSSEKAAPILLIVEDNEDVRYYIRNNLGKEFIYEEAVNGIEGLEKAIQVIPDLIISDLMMPKMDGVELCHRLKTDERTSHIPVIMLTARASLDTKLTGLRTGADDYITKPFNIEELKIRVKNLIEQREKLRKRFSREITLQPSDITITDKDEEFLQNAIRMVEAHIADDQFTVEAFQKQIGMSRMQLHRKLKALTDQSAGEFIRLIRMKRAAQLLQQKEATVSEVAYEVGFNDPSYFTKCFRSQFGISPSEYVQQTMKTSG